MSKIYLSALFLSLNFTFFSLFVSLIGASGAVKVQRYLLCFEESNKILLFCASIHSQKKPLIASGRQYQVCLRSVKGS